MDFLLDVRLLFSNLGPEGMERSAQFLAIFTNFTPERSELIARFFASFTNLGPNRVKLLFYFCLFGRICTRLELTFC